jgi:serine/threonine protein kinase
MPRLAWLAYAGNPFCEAAEEQAVARNPIQTITWSQLEVRQQLGEGASGVIYQARWQPENSPAAEVAVKLFKGALTSDGLPHSEMAACISAGSHPNLIAVEGKVSNHPAGAEGLVLELISPAYQNLAGPPSLASCTRDVYAPEASFSLDAALQTAAGIASAAKQLHARGIMHGDLYAHNILTTTEGEALLGDFGAACFFTPEAQETSQALQRLEVRAFACLLEELLARCVVAPAPPATIEKLWELQERCAQPNVAARPLFDEIHDSLERIWASVGEQLAS